jgi:hypothetical protein
VQRINYLGAPQYQNLQCACAMLVRAFGEHIFLVGSCLDKREYRDVDVRCILPDADFDRLFPNASGNSQHTDALWCLICPAIAEWLRARTDLPIDFQIQRHTEANTEFHYGKRQHLGLFRS